MDEQRKSKQTDESRLTAYRQLTERLPLTMRPSLNQQLAAWNTLFPFERNRLAQFMQGVQTFQPVAFQALIAPLTALEMKMGVEHWDFSLTSDTMENASLLARSEFYGEWRREVQKVFEAIHAAGQGAARSQDVHGRFILLVFPESLPIDSPDPWKQWDPRGREFKIAGDSRKLCELVTRGQAGLPGISALLAGQGCALDSDLWLIDAEDKLGGLTSAAPATAPCALSYATLKSFRDKFLAEINTAPKNIQASDQLLAAVRHEDWDRWWPAQLTGQERLRKFVIDLFLSGNGALNFSSAFVEWAASEAMRRARPRVIVARFGLRSKPKPFTSIAIFENQQRISTLPDEDDHEGSAVDALILARYVWLAASRYPEQEQTCCLCVSESRNSVFLIAPPSRSPQWSAQYPVHLEDIHKWIVAQLLLSSNAR